MAWSRTSALPAVARDIWTRRARLKEAGVGTLVLVHLTEQLEQIGVKERVLFEVGEVFDGRVIYGEDLAAVPLGETEIMKVR